MSPKGSKGDRDKPVFSAPEPRRPGRGPHSEPRGSRGGAGARRASRPLAELQEKLTKETRRKTVRVSVKERLARAFPLFGVIGPGEIGLAIAIIGAVTMIWIWPHLLHWGLVVVAMGFVIMRYGERWLRGG